MLNVVVVVGVNGHVSVRNTLKASPDWGTHRRTGGIKVNRKLPRTTWNAYGAIRKFWPNMVKMHNRSSAGGRRIRFFLRPWLLRVLFMYALSLPLQLPLRRVLRYHISSCCLQTLSDSIGEPLGQPLISSGMKYLRALQDDRIANKSWHKPDYGI